jgi:hypothetical protein
MLPLYLLTQIPSPAFLPPCGELLSCRLPETKEITASNTPLDCGEKEPLLRNSTKDVENVSCVYMGNGPQRKRDKKPRLLYASMDLPFYTDTFQLLL